MKQFLIFPTLIFVFQSAFGQDIKIFHGKRNESSILFQEREGNHTGSVWQESWKDENRIIRPQGSNVEVVILNPNPFFYNYSIKTEDFEIKEEAPDITQLLVAINSITTISNGSGSMGAPSEPNAFKIYSNAIEQLSAQIKLAKSSIEASDDPGSDPSGALSENFGYRKAIADIRAQGGGKGEFNDKKLLDNLNSLLEDADKDNSLYVGLELGQIANEATKNKIKNTYKKSFEIQNQELASIVSQILKTVESEPSTIRFYIPVKSSGTKIRLIIEKKGNKDLPLRMVNIDKIIAVIYPEYKRNKIELVPVANLTYANNTTYFAMSNGLVTSEPGDGYKFRGGAMLLFNVFEFGRYNEGSWGIGLGYNIPKNNVFESFYLGTLLGYKKYFSIGAGFGFSDYPYRLKGDAKVGAILPPDIKNLEDIIEYRRKPSLFISFSISGLTLKK